MTLLLLEAERLHGAVHLPSESPRDEVQVVGYVLGVGVDRDDGTAGKHDRDAMGFEGRAHESGEVLEGGVFVDVVRSAHTGLPARRGRLRSVK